MENQLQIADFETFGKVRFVIIDGEPWFVAADVCKILGIVNYRDAVTRLDDDERGKTFIPDKTPKNGVTDTIGKTDTPPGQEMLVVNEPGLYRLIFASRKPEAKAFKRKVYHEILPSIRKTAMYIAETGMYISDPIIRKQLDELLHALQVAEDFKSKPKIARYYREYADILGFEVAERTVARSDIAQKALDIKEINGGTRVEFPHYLRRFIAEFCIFDRYAHLHADIFIQRLREEFPTSSAADSNRAIISDLRYIRGIAVMRDPAGTLLYGIRFA